MRCGLLGEHKDIFNIRLFDGSILYMPTKLPNEETVLFSTRKTDGKKIKLIVKFTKQLPSEQCPHLYNILLRRVMHILQMCQVGRYYYNPSTPSNVPAHKLEVWPGYISAIKEHEGGLFLMLDSSHRVLRTETVLDMMSKLAQEKPSSFQDDVIKNLLGCIVLTRYNNKTYRIDDIEWDKNPSDTFETSSGKSVTFQEYYWTHYGKKVDGNQPLLIHRPKARKVGGATIQPRTEVICLIPELCYLTGLTDDMRKNYSVMKDLAAHTRVTPTQRLETMKKFIDSINKNDTARTQLEEWGLMLDTSAIAVDGRQLNIETITMGSNAKFSAGPRAEWSREMSNCQLISTVDLNHWLILYIQRNLSEVNSLLLEVSRVTPLMGMSVQQPIRVVLNDDKTDTLIRSLRQNVNPKIQLVMVVFPTSRDDKYNAVKKYTFVDCPVPSQVILSNTLRKKDKLKSVVQKIMFQVNVKLGGVLWAVKIPLERLMVIGIDTFHDAAHGRRSIGGFVSNIDPDCTRWFSRVCIQMKSEELLSGLSVCVTAAIRKYYEVNHFLPEKIVVYRDGVGDGQLPMVSDYEVQQIESCFAKFGADYFPKTTVIVVQKRINTRIFLRENDRKLENPPSGTVLDHTVTKRDMYDFFLVSQHVRQGTVSPTHYIVLHDNIGLPPERNQALAYKMTHLYYNWPGTVRVPAPCLYAHKLSYLVGQSLHKAPSEELCDRLFFL
ncbi:piwi-like protein 1 [Pomacea canaliculata]|uniref:piwi-like protein 1 n=1 Tax=Pomacea canaliculata TaxID=400727 RepID=UPI000D73069D|nr:piwi-like protein 1 [Pomacea canaliculata]